MSQAAERIQKMTLEELQEYKQQLQEKREKYLDAMDTFPRKQEDWLPSEWQMKHDYDEILDLIYHVKLEIVTQEQGLREKDIAELEVVSHEAYRRARSMQHYSMPDWDSTEGNLAGFWKEIDFLETLETAANLEIERRNLGNK